MVRSGCGLPMGLHVRRSDRGELVRGVDHVRGVGGDLLGMEVVEGRVHEDLGGDRQRREAMGHEARMGQPRCLHRRELRWAGLEPRVLGQAVGRGVHGGHELHVFRHGVGRAGKATDPKGCRSIRSIHSRGCHQRQGD